MRINFVTKCLFLATLAVSAALSQQVNAAAVTPADDAYHFKYWEGSPLNAAYNEWWYFNLYDVKDDLQAIFSYQVADPLNLTGQGVSDLSAVVYEHGNIIPESDLYPLSSFSASYSVADVTLGSNTISVEGPRTYVIAGATLDGRISWNLSYYRDAPSWFAANRVNVAPASWELMSWLLYMPRALVSGTLSVDGHTYNINCTGYHDHNWGEWDFENVLWNWAQYSKPGLTFDLGDFIGNPNGRASVDIEGKRYVFDAQHYKLVDTKWAFDPIDNVSYPTQSVFTAEEGGVKVDLTMDVQNTAPLATGPPPSLVIYEQPSRFTGTVTLDRQESDRHESPIVIPFAGDGFKEYTARSSPTP